MPSKTRGSLLRENGMLRGAENKDKADAIRLREMTLQEALTAGKWKLCRNSGGHRVSNNSHHSTPNTYHRSTLFEII
jgi:hypothetical protein